MCILPFLADLCKLSGSEFLRAASSGHNNAFQGGADFTDEAKAEVNPSLKTTDMKDANFSYFST